jgi:hypothetical protein
VYGLGDRLDNSADVLFGGLPIGHCYSQQSLPLPGSSTEPYRSVLLNVAFDSVREGGVTDTDENLVQHYIVDDFDARDLSDTQRELPGKSAATIDEIGDT